MLCKVVGKYCAYKDLVDGTLSLYDFYSMLRIADWQDYVQEYAYNASKD